MEKLHASITKTADGKWKLLYFMEKLNISEDGRLSDKMEFSENLPLIFITREEAKQEAENKAKTMGTEIIIQE